MQGLLGSRFSHIQAEPKPGASCNPVSKGGNSPASAVAGINTLHGHTWESDAQPGRRFGARRAGSRCLLLGIPSKLYRVARLLFTHSISIHFYRVTPSQLSQENGSSLAFLESGLSSQALNWDLPVCYKLLGLTAKCLCSLKVSPSFPCQGHLFTFTSAWDWV